MEEFQDLISNCELQDLEFKGFPFTWCNNREGEERIFELLDRFLVDIGWCDLFSEATVTHSLVAYSDHSPLWLETTSTLPARKGPKPFRFEAVWVREEEYTRII